MADHPAAPMVLTQIAGVPGAKPSTTHLAIAESTSVDQPGNTAAGSHNPTQFASLLADLRAPGQAPEATDHADSISGKLTHEGSAEPSDSPFALEITTGYTLPPTGSVPPQDGRYLPLAPSEMASDRPLLSSENSPADNPISNTSQPDGSTGGVTRSGPATAPPVPIADTSAAPPGRQPDQVLMTTADLPQVDSIRETITPRASPPGESRQLQNLVEPGDSAAATGRSSTEFSSAGGFASSRESDQGASRDQSSHLNRLDRLEADPGSKFPSINLSRTDLAPALTGPSPGGTLQSTLANAADLSLFGDRSTWTVPLAERLAAFVKDGVNTAELRLNPPNLGHLEVRISIHQDQATILLSTTNVEVREVLQQAMPRLEGLLANLGIQLTDSTVTDQQFGQLPDQHHGSAKDEPAGGEVADDEPASGPLKLGLVDTYA